MFQLFILFYPQYLPKIATGGVLAVRLAVAAAAAAAVTRSGKTRRRTPTKTSQMREPAPVEAAVAAAAVGTRGTGTRAFARFTRTMRTLVAEYQVALKVASTPIGPTLTLFGRKSQNPRVISFI